MVSVNDVGRLGELPQVVDHANAARGYLLGRRPERRRVDDRPVASAQQTEREVARDGFRSAALGEPHIREQNDQSVRHPRQFVSVADPGVVWESSQLGQPAGAVHRGWREAKRKGHADTPPRTGSDGQTLLFNESPEGRAGEGNRLCPGFKHARQK